MTNDPGRCERGYAMAALLVAMAVMAVALSTALPVFKTVAQREREAELVFRGEQYARAIGMFQRKYANALPPSIDVLVEERFLRKHYKDPITGDDFQVLGPNSPELAQAMAALPQQVQQQQQQQQGRGRGAQSGAGAPQSGRGGIAPGGPTSMFQGGTSQGGSPTFMRDTQSALSTLARETQGGRSAGGIMAVASKSKDSSLRLYNGKGKYNEWVFMALQTSTTAGGPPGSGAPTPGGRGGAQPGAPRGQQPGTPRGGFPAPGGAPVPPGPTGAPRR